MIQSLLKSTHPNKWIKIMKPHLKILFVKAILFSKKNCMSKINRTKAIIWRKKKSWKKMIAVVKKEKVINWKNNYQTVKSNFLKIQRWDFVCVVVQQTKTKKWFSAAFVMYGIMLDASTWPKISSKFIPKKIKCGSVANVKTIIFLKIVHSVLYSHHLLLKNNFKIMI
jgi:hypothetical protein